MKKIFNSFAITLLTFMCSCGDDIDSPDIPVIPPTEQGVTSFVFEKAKNPDYIQNDLTMNINGNDITGILGYYTDVSNLIPTFSLNGKELLLDGETQVSGESSANFNKPVEYQLITEEDESVAYQVSLLNYTGIPIVDIHTENAAPIESKDNWINATIKIHGGVDYPDLEEVACKVKGRGNSTWGLSKKPYAIKLDKKAAILDMPAHKRWVLLANYYDPTALKTQLAFHMGEKYTDLEYTPRYRHAMVFMNDNPQGLYDFGEQIKIDKNRVNLSNEGCLLEVDYHADSISSDDVYFTSAFGYKMTIKDPDVVFPSPQYDEIRERYNRAENAIVSDDFLDAELGYKAYWDLQSLCDWYLINEISLNTDAAFRTSCYITMDKDKKLKMGPLWDFDLAFCFIDSETEPDSPQGLYIGTYFPFDKLFKDPIFKNAVKERFNEIYSHLDDINEFIDNKSSILKHSLIEENKIWQLICKSPSSDEETLNSHQEKVKFMKTWLKERMEWLHQEFNKM
ncbi:MAG: CotH kinase family protein [Prevotella sp.]|nr:CotH kinase family protein [Prevotella sp.]